ncbi:MAG TPA: ATP synthase subunit I, partial [Acidimicrobiales bacterium]|nr:ATP synthase subunit I [Acidimicrobiales bacterium]
MAAPAGEAPEYELVGDLLRKALPVAPVAVAVAAVFAGIDGALSAGVGVALVAGNLLLAAASLVWAGRISLG